MKIYSDIADGKTKQSNAEIEQEETSEVRTRTYEAQRSHLHR